MRRIVFAALLALAPGSLPGQISGWHTVRTTDDLTAAEDVRAILRADEWPRLTHSANPDEYKGATLIVACGDRVPGDSGRSLLLFAGEPLEPFGGEYGYAELRFDRQTKPLKEDLTILDYGNALVVPTGARSTRHIAFLGDAGHPYFAASIFRSLMSASELTLQYRVFGALRTVHFRLAGLGEALRALPGCSWPT